MAKENGKRFRRKSNKLDKPNAKIKKKAHEVSSAKAIDLAPAAPTEATASDPPVNNDEGTSEGKEIEIQKPKRLSGFIFMCNPSTKLECYQYRVFGLPMGQKGLVEEIRPGSKLFLYDFELKLLYGIYEATSVGKVNLEPAAFKGRFPAQVKFKIFKECLPMPESSVRSVIKENYTGSKFKQDLNGKQVKKLLSSFRPLNASLGQPAPQALANVPPPPWARPPSAIQNHYKHNPYIPQPVNPQTGQKANYLQPGYNRTSAYVERVPPTLHHQSLPATSSRYVDISQRPSFIQGVVAHGVQQPVYSRHRAIEERPPHEQLPSLERYRPVEQRTSHDEVTNLARHYLQMPSHRETLHQINTAAYNSNRTAPAQYTSSAPQAPSPYQPLPFQRGPLYEDNVAQALYAAPAGSQPQALTHSGYASSTGSQPQAPTQSQYASAIMQPQAPGHYHQLPSERETVYQDNLGAYSSYPAGSAQYTSSVTQTESLAPTQSQYASAIMQPQVPGNYHQLPSQRETVYQDSLGAYSSYPAASAQYTSSITQTESLAPPGVSQGSTPVLSYYSYAASHLSR